MQEVFSFYFFFFASLAFLNRFFANFSTRVPVNSFIALFFAKGLPDFFIRNLKAVSVR